MEIDTAVGGFGDDHHHRRLQIITRETSLDDAFAKERERESEREKEIETSGNWKIVGRIDADGYFGDLRFPFCGPNFSRAFVSSITFESTEKEWMRPEFALFEDVEAKSKRKQVYSRFRDDSIYFKKSWGIAIYIDIPVDALIASLLFHRSTYPSPSLRGKEFAYYSYSYLSWSAAYWIYPFTLFTGRLREPLSRRSA